MDSRPDAAPGGRVDRCGEQRAAVGSLCDEARRAQSEHAASTDRTRELRRQLVAAQHRQVEAAAAAEPSRRTDEKAEARQAYGQAQAVAGDDEEQRNAAAGQWARAVDRINRSSRLAQRAAFKAKLEVDRLEEAAREADRAEHAARIAAESAEAACLDARVRLATCEEQAQEPEPAPATTASTSGAPTAAHRGELPALPHDVPLVIESLVAGDRRALDMTATLVAEHTGLQHAEALLQLQELVDAIVSVASAEGYLVFDDQHPFWAHLGNEEAGDVIAALARLGFQFEPAEGWHAGRAPTPMDLSMALAYAGLDARGMRDLPSTEQLRVLPQSISVDARAFLAERAPDLAVDHVVGLLGRRASQLEPLWNEWGQVRPILLSDRRNLGLVPG